MSARVAVAAGADPLSVVADCEQVREFIDEYHARLGHHQGGWALAALARWVIATDPTAEQPDGRVALAVISSERLRAWRQQLPTRQAPKTAAIYRSWVGRYYAWLHQRQVVSARLALAGGADPLSVIADRDQVREFVADHQARLGHRHPGGAALAVLARWVIATDPTAEQPDCPVALPPAGSARLDAWRRQLPTMLAPKTAHDYGSWAGRYYAWLHQRQIVSAEVKATASGRG